MDERDTAQLPSLGKLSTLLHSVRPFCRLREDEVSLNDNGQRAQSANEARLTTYMQPSMNFNEEKFDNVLREVEDVDLALQGKKVRLDYPCSRLFWRQNCVDVSNHFKIERCDLQRLWDDKTWQNKLSCISCLVLGRACFWEIHQYLEDILMLKVPVPAYLPWWPMTCIAVTTPSVSCAFTKMFPI